MGGEAVGSDAGGARLLKQQLGARKCSNGANLALVPPVLWTSPLYPLISFWVLQSPSDMQRKL